MNSSRELKTADMAAYMREYMRKWRATSPKYKAWRLRLARRRIERYANDETYRETCKARAKAYYIRKHSTHKEND